MEVARVHLQQLILVTCIMSRSEKFLDEALVNSDAKCRKRGGLGWLGVTQGHQYSIQNSYSTSVETMCLSCSLPFTRYSDI